MALNIVALMGRLTRDPEMRKTPQGVSVATFTVAVDRSFVKQGEDRQADFIDIVCWRNTADFVCKYFQKGSMIALNGSIQTRTYQDKNGNNRKAFEIVADTVHFAGAKSSGEKVQTGSEHDLDMSPGDDFEVISDDEDLPF